MPLVRFPVSTGTGSVPGKREPQVPRATRQVYQQGEQMSAAIEEEEGGIVQVSSADDKLVLQADFPGVTPGELFAYWTEPVRLVRWWPNEAEVQPDRGGEYHLSWPGMEWHLRGRYMAFEPGRKLAFTWHWDHEPNRPTRSVVVTFREITGGTLLTLGHGTYGHSPEDREERAGHREGWLYFLDRLQTAVGEQQED